MADAEQGQQVELDQKSRRTLMWGAGLVGLFVIAVIMSNLDNSDAESDPPKAEAGSAAETIAEQGQAIWTAFADAAKTCDDAGEPVRVQLQGEGGDPYSAYAAAKEAGYACEVASSAIYRLEPPDSAPEALQEQFRTAIQSCDDAYRGKMKVYQRLAKVLNGDGRPSAVSALREEMQSADAHLMACVPQMMAAVEEATGELPQTSPSS